jgi:uncharacterized membrane protein
VNCRSCGTEIADKAIICYRCGAATTDPVRRPVEIRKRRGRLLPLIALLVMVLAGVYLGVSGQTVVPPGYVLPAGLAIGVAIVLLVIATMATGRRR